MFLQLCKLFKKTFIRNQRSDQLSKRLEQRPSSEELRARNILRGNASLSPQLQAAQLEVEKQQKATHLSNFIASRPAMIEIKSENETK